MKPMPKKALMPMVVTWGRSARPGGDGDGAHDAASLRGVREGEAVREEFTMNSKSTG